jgi:hypothetical protein
MSSCLLRSVWLSGLLIASAATAQVYWKIDFDSPPQYWGPSLYSKVYFQSPFPSLNSTNLDVGPPHNNVLCVQADCSNEVQYPWTVGCTMWSRAAPTMVYDPANTFFRFDVLVSHAEPFHVRLEFASTNTDARDLDVDVTPAATNVFQTFLVPLWAFTNTTWVIHGAAPPNFPSALDFSISGNPTNSSPGWPSASDNMFMVDNISYVVSPPMTISSLGETVVVSWPTNTTDFVLQQAADLTHWNVVTNTPVVSNGVNQVILSPAVMAGFYRLSGP